ncbi:hypothetical protein [Sphingobacterium sp.]|uniref:hypothetical protein n=1 Tax=Sphingobacterium sp. TaxID=341027 RepID=UPI0028B0CB3A|nr:hypothetical protein [Sphingobacterium sp.]
MRDYAISPYAIADKYSPRSLVQTMILVHPVGEPVEPPSRTLSIEGHHGSFPDLGPSGG